ALPAELTELLPRLLAEPSEGELPEAARRSALARLALLTELPLALLPLLALALLSALRAEGLVEQLPLPTHDVAEALQGFVHGVLLRGALAILVGLALLTLLTALVTGHHSHIFQHLHQGRQHLPRLIAIAGPSQILNGLQQVLQILLRH